MLQTFKYLVSLILIIPTLAIAVDIPVVDKSERHKYWEEAKSFSFPSSDRLWGKHKPGPFTSSGFCFNASFVIESNGSVYPGSVELLKYDPEKYGVNQIELNDYAIKHLKSTIARQQKYSPVTQNSKEQAIRTNIVFYREGNKNSKDYISGIDKACDFVLKKNLLKLTYEKSVKSPPVVKKNNSDQAPSFKNLEPYFKSEAKKMSSQVCNNQSLDCSCIEQMFLKEAELKYQSNSDGIKSNQLPLDYFKKKVSGEARKAVGYRVRRKGECKSNQTEIKPPPKAQVSIREINQEGQNILVKCENDLKMRQNFVCSCLAKRFSEERVKVGPDKDESHILGLLASECVNYEEKTKAYRKRCIEKPVFFDLKGVDKSDFCQCASDIFESTFKSYTGRVDYTSEGRLQGNAEATCRRDLIPR